MCDSLPSPVSSDWPTSCADFPPQEQAGVLPAWQVHKSRQVQAGVPASLALTTNPLISGRLVTSVTSDQT